MLGEDDILVCIPTTIHLFGLIPGSEESQCPMLSLDLWSVTIWPLVIEMWLGTWSYYVSTFLLFDLSQYSSQLFNHWVLIFTYLLNSGSSNSDQWFLNYAPFIRFLCSGGGDVKFCFDLSHYLPSSLDNDTPWKVHYLPLIEALGQAKYFIHSWDITLFPHPFPPWGRITAFRHISGGAYWNIYIDPGLNW